jgi:hypothetical protein
MHKEAIKVSFLLFASALLIVSYILERRLQVQVQSLQEHQLAGFTSTYNQQMKSLRDYLENRNNHYTLPLLQGSVVYCDYNHEYQPIEIDYENHEFYRFYNGIRRKGNVLTTRDAVILLYESELQLVEILLINTRDPRGLPIALHDSRLFSVSNCKS